MKGCIECSALYDLSVIIISKNEAKNIRRCLESVRWADEIIVVDAGSTDNTLSIAREFSDQVFVAKWHGYGIQKQRALEYASRAWVLNIDADEVVGSDLQQTLITALETCLYDAYRIPIRMNFYGKTLRYSSSPRRHIRLFRRDGAHYSDDIVHEKIMLPSGAKIGRLNAPLIHYCYNDVSHLLDKINRYSSYSAGISIDANKQNSLIKTMFATIWMFFRAYILQRGILDGRLGLIFAIFNSHGAFYRGIKQIYHDDDVVG